MKRYFPLAIIIVSLIVIDIIIGNVTVWLIKNEPESSTEHSKIAQALLHKKADILILGASGAESYYIPSIISEKTGLSTYNAGLNGNGILYSYAVFDAFLSRCTPKVVIYDANTGLLNGETSYRLLNHKWLYGISDPMTRVIDSYSDNTDKLKLLSNTYRLNGQFFKLIKANLAERESFDGYGIEHTIGNPNGKWYFVEDQPYEFDSLCLFYFNKMADVCNEKGILFIVCYTPRLACSSAGYFQLALKSLCQEKGCLFFNYDGDKEYVTHPEWYRDDKHMNTEGATVFSNNFSDVINDVIKNQTK